jgi:hypothetical protein
MVEQRKLGRRSDGRFVGSWARLNCEAMPVIPAWIVRANLDDPRRISYLLVWKDERYSGEVKEAVRLMCFTPCGKESRKMQNDNDCVEIKRTDGSATVLPIVWRPLPRNGGRALLLLCPHCNVPRRFVYGWEWDSFSGWSNRVRQVSWCCRSCNRLRYSSEGGRLRGRGRGAVAAIFRAYGNLPRPEPWFPCVFTSIDDPQLDEFLRSN